jgi:hypothetical protein
MFFFEKKNQTTIFHYGQHGWPSLGGAAAGNRSKFFASHF